MPARHGHPAWRPWALAISYRTAAGNLLPRPAD